MSLSVLKRSWPLIIGIMAVWPSVANAVPYASKLSESGGTVSFLLNEDADSVTIRRTGDTDLNLGSLTKGPQSFSLGSASAYEIEVSRSAAAGWTQISDDSNVQSQFFSPRGVAVNRNPSSPHFGNIYVSEGVGGQTANRTEETLDGLFVMGADQSDFLGQVNDGRIGGLDTDGSNSPFKITVAPDDSVYIADWNDATGGVYRAPADLSESSDWPNVLANDNRDSNAGGLTDNHGSIPSVWVEGTGASTKLYTMDEDWPAPAGGDTEGRGDIFRYDIGTATNYAAQPIVQVGDDTPSPSGVILNGLMDFVRDEDGTWWISQFRSDDTKSVPALSRWADGGTEPLFVSGKDAREVGDFDFDTDVDGEDFLIWQTGFGKDNGSSNAFDGDANGDMTVDGVDLGLWEENFGNPSDPGVVLEGAYGTLDIHNELDLLVVGTRFGQGVYVVDISDPDDPNIVDIIPQAFRTRDVAFDIAGNVYVVSSSTETLRIWSPGGDSVATTRSNGTFELVQPGSIGAVPEPGSAVLLLLGLTAMTGRMRTRS